MKYKTTVLLDIVSNTKLKPVKLSMIQSPGPIPYLFNYKPSSSMDPYVDSIKVLDEKKVKDEVAAMVDATKETLMKAEAEYFVESSYDEVGSFWVVTIPSDKAILEDILFEADIDKMLLLGAGGLKANEIYGVYKSQGQAKRVAEFLLSSR